MMARIQTVVLVLGVAALGWTQMSDQAHATDTLFDVPDEPEYKYFDVISHDFGDGIVQIHTRKEGPSGTSHAVQHIDCIQQRSDDIYAGAIPPDGFPMGSPELPAGNIENNPDLVSVAQHACKKHGYPLLQW